MAQGYQARGFRLIVFGQIAFVLFLLLISLGGLSIFNPAWFGPIAAIFAPISFISALALLDAGRRHISMAEGMRLVLDSKEKKSRAKKK